MIQAQSGCRFDSNKDVLILSVVCLSIDSRAFSALGPKEHTTISTFEIVINANLISVSSGSSFLNR